MPNTRPLQLRIPDELDFSALKLARDPQSGGMLVDWQTVEQVCDANGVDQAVFRDAPEDNPAGFVMAWYAEHRARGGAPDAAMEDLISEARAEDEHGGGLSHQPGRA